MKNFFITMFVLSSFSVIAADFKIHLNNSLSDARVYRETGVAIGSNDNGYVIELIPANDAVESSLNDFYKKAKHEWVTIVQVNVTGSVLSTFTSNRFNGKDNKQSILVRKIN